MEYNILICDAEKSNLEINKLYIQTFASKMNLAANLYCFSEVNTDMEKLLNNGAIDIAFLGMKIRRECGLEVAKRILDRNPWAIIIFVTSYLEYARQAYQIQAFGYIEKPVKAKQLEGYFIKAVYLCEMIKNKRESQSVIIKWNRNIFKIRQKEIIYIEKILRKVMIHTTSGIYDVYDSMTSLEQQLDENFLRVNQGTIVKIDEISSIQKNSINLRTGESFTIGRTFAKQVKEICSRHF